MLISMQKTVFNFKIYYILSNHKSYTQVINLYFSPNSSYRPGLQVEYLIVQVTYTRDPGTSGKRLPYTFIIGKILFEFSKMG